MICHPYPSSYTLYNNMCTRVMQFQLPLVFATSEAKRLLEEAMKDGSVTVKLVKVLVVGSAGVGKTSLIKLLLDQDPPEERNSTGCLERPIRVIRIIPEKGDQEEKWNEISQEELDEMIAEAVPVILKDMKQKSAEKKNAKKSTNIGHGENANKEKEKKEKSQDREQINMNKEGQAQDTTTSVLHATNATMPQGPSEAVVTETIDTVREKLARLVSSTKSSERLLNMELIYLTDTGGQQAYWDLAPIFTRDTTATLFVHRLCDKLDDTPLNDVYERGERVGPSQKARITTAQAFKTMLQNLACGENRSKIIVIGTHKDVASFHEETLDHKNKTIEEIASTHFSSDISFSNEGYNEVIFKKIQMKVIKKKQEKSKQE